MGGNNNNNFEQFANNICIKMYTHVVAYFYLYASIMLKMCLVPIFNSKQPYLRKKDE